MIADIFYPIFNLTIIILAYFIRKKSKIVQGFAYTHSPRHCPGPPGGPQTPVSTVFGFAKNRCAHIFSVLSPDFIKLFQTVPPSLHTNNPLLSSSYTSTFPLHTDKFIFRQLRIFHKIKLAEKKNLSPNV